jgi:3'-5' exonuclease
MTPVLVFDIETVPDVDGLRKLYDIPDFLPTHLHRVLVISCLLRSDEGLRVFSIGAPDADERSAIQRFFEGIDKYVPQIVSWNGRGFDLPVLAARGLLNGVTAGCFWDTGADNKDFKWSNYINRFHDRHLDLMDALSIYGGGRGSPLDELAQLCGFPGKLGMDGSEVWDQYRKGATAAIRDYCETDVFNTYLLYLRFQLMRCAYSAERYASEIALARATLERRTEPHWGEFLKLWKT